MWKAAVVLVVVVDLASAYPTDGAENMPLPKQEMGGLIRPRWMQFLAMGNTKTFATPDLACEDIRIRFGKGNYFKAKSIKMRDSNSNVAYDCTFPAVKKGEQDWFSQGQVTGEWVCPEPATIEDAAEKKYMKLGCQCPSNMFAQGNRCVPPELMSDPCAFNPVPPHLEKTPLSQRPVDAARCPMSHLACTLKEFLAGADTGTFGAQLPKDRVIDPVALTKSTIAVSWGNLKNGTDVKILTTNDSRLYDAMKKLIEDGLLNVGYKDKKPAGVTQVQLAPEPPLKKGTPEKPNNEHAEDAAYRFWETQQQPNKRNYTIIGTCPKGCQYCSTEYVDKHKDMRFERLDPLYGN
jgi:hypothetical protein